MFGIYFFFNLDLRRILTDYGFKFFPLRKDFPIYGYTELLYNDILKKISYNNVLVLSQELRNFKFVTRLKHDSFHYQIKTDKDFTYIFHTLKF
jgi:NADH-quinone oxidoreductase subunit C